MEIQQLRHLLAAVRHGNLLKAADESNISQSGISRSIKSLEDRLGVPLLIRKAKGVEPTVYGASLLRRAKVILNEVARGVEEVRAIEEARTGDVSFGITQNYASYIVPEIVAEVTRERPGMGITVQTGGFLELIEMVKVEAIDFAFGIIGPLQRDDGIVIESLREHQSCVIAGAHHLLAAKENVTVQDLAAARWLMLSSESVQRSFTSFFERHGLEAPPQVIKTDSITLIRRIASESDVLTILPREAVQKKIDQGVLVELDCLTPVEKSRIGIFYRDGGLLTPQAHFVIDHLRRAFGAPSTLKKRRRFVPQPVY
jgi:LysR family transcriptional regulator, regulator of abg operon